MISESITGAYSFPQPSGPMIMKGCLLPVWSQDRKVSWFRCRSGVRTTGGGEPERSDKVRVSGSCNNYESDKHTHMYTVCLHMIAHDSMQYVNFCTVPEVGRWPAGQC